MVVRSECRRTESERERLLTVKRYRANGRTTANAFCNEFETVADRVRNFESLGKKSGEERSEATSSPKRRERDGRGATVHEDS